MNFSDSEQFASDETIITSDLEGMLPSIGEDVSMFSSSPSQVEHNMPEPSSAYLLTPALEDNDTVIPVQYGPLLQHEDLQAIDENESDDEELPEGIYAGTFTSFIPSSIPSNVVLSDQQSPAAHAAAFNVLMGQLSQHPPQWPPTSLPVLELNTVGLNNATYNQVSPQLPALSPEAPGVLTDILPTSNNAPLFEASTSHPDGTHEVEDNENTLSTSPGVVTTTVAGTDAIGSMANIEASTTADEHQVAHESSLRHSGTHTVSPSHQPVTQLDVHSATNAAHILPPSQYFRMPNTKSSRSRQNSGRRSQLSGMLRRRHQEPVRRKGIYIPNTSRSRSVEPYSRLRPIGTPVFKASTELEDAHITPLSLARMRDELDLSYVCASPINLI
jgi:hypothetical protein